jgi:hypothetical protein
MIDSRDCSGIALGVELELFAAADEVVLVPHVAEPSAVAPAAKGERVN